MGYPSIPGDVIMPDPISDGLVNKILATIRSVESGNNYTAQASGSSASGAYQIIDSTWVAWSAAAGHPSFGHAKDAKPAVQDAVAGSRVKRILSQYDNRLSSVPITWYLPSALTNASKMDQVPAGNTMTPRDYATHWLSVYQATGLSTGGDAATGLSTGDIPGADMAVGALTTASDAIGSVTDFLKLLADPQTLIRVVKITAGVMAIITGLVIITKTDVEVGKAVPSAATMAGTAVLV